MANEKNPATDGVREGERIAKIIARSGYCSRRAAETLIEEGRVAVNGKRLTSPAFNVGEKDHITINDEPLTQKEATRMWLYHKPAGLVVSESDPEGRPTVFEKFKEAGLPRVLTVGRLDINTEGLLMLTNDGGLKRVLELPATGWTRRYRVRAYGRITQEKLDELKDGITIDKVHYGAIEATLERQQGGNAWVLVSLKEGKNREVKNVLSALGLEVNRLIRLSYGPFQLNQMKLGEIQPVKTRMLKDQLSAKLIAEAGLDFDAPINPIELKKPEKVDKYGRGKPRGRIDRPVRPERTRRDEKRDEPKRQEGPKSRVFYDDGRTEYIERPQPKTEGDEREGRGGRGPGRDKWRDKSGRGDKRDYDKGPRSDKGFRSDKGRGGDKASRSDKGFRSDKGPREDKASRADKGSRGDKGGKTFVSAKRGKDFGSKRGGKPNAPQRPGGRPNASRPKPKGR